MRYRIALENNMFTFYVAFIVATAPTAAPIIIASTHTESQCHALRKQVAAQDKTLNDPKVIQAGGAYVCLKMVAEEN